jgi:hypothetical protein
MIYNDGGGAIKLSGSGGVTLSPPSSGTYAGLCLYQNRTSTTGVTLTGLSQYNITGGIYCARANLTLKGGTVTNVLGTQIVADSLRLTGTGTVQVGGANGSGKDIRIVE